MSFIIFFLINVVRVLKFALIVRILLSWIQSPYQQGKFYRIVFDMTEPFLKPIRQLIPRAGMFDVSVLIAYVLLELIGSYLNGYYLTLI